VINNVKNEEDRLNDDDSAVVEVEGEDKNRKSRRIPTPREREARYDKHLADRNGISRIDPCEPSLVGLPCGAIDSATRLLKRSWRARQMPSAKRIARKVANISGLTPTQAEVLRKWLSWIIDRRWILLEPDRSTAVEWVKSEPLTTDIWTKELDAAWHSKIDTKARAGQKDHKSDQALSRALAQSTIPPVKTDISLAKAESPSRTSAPVAPPLVAPKPQAVRRPDPELFSSSPVQQPAPALTFKPKALGTGDANTGVQESVFKFPRVPSPWFKEGNYTANAFFKAVENQSVGEARAAAEKLSKSPAFVREIFGRSKELGECLELVFRQLGISVPRF